MGGPTFVIDPAVLRGEAARLRDAASSLSGSTTISSPDCGSSSQEVDDLIKRILEELGNGARSASALASAIDTACTTFVRVDQSNAQRFPTAQPGPSPTLTP